MYRSVTPGMSPAAILVPRACHCNVHFDDLDLILRKQLDVAKQS